MTDPREIKTADGKSEVIGNEQLRREIQVGLDEIQRGEIALLDVAVIKRKARAQWASQRRDE